MLYMYMYYMQQQRISFMFWYDPINQKLSVSDVKKRKIMEAVRHCDQQEIRMYIYIFLNVLDASNIQQINFISR